MKRTKKSMWLCGVALAICLTMLLGATFAWFTDSVTNEGNNITAGTLNIELNDGDKTVLFSSDDLWEPGYSQTATATVKNVGSLWLKYTMMFENVETAGGTIDPNADITEVLDVYLLEEDDETPSNTGLDGATRLGTVKELMAAGSFAAKDAVLAPAGYVGKDGSSTDTFTLAIKMQESAGNKYQGASVSFDVVILATQYTYETDGFGNPNYDAGATYPATPSTLQDAINNLKEGDTLVLAAGEYNTNITIPLDNVTIVGAGADETKINGSIKLGKRASNVAGSWTLNGVAVAGTVSNNHLAMSIENAGNGSVLAIEDCVFENYEYGPQFASDVTNGTLSIKNTEFKNVWCAISIKTALRDNTSTGNKLVQSDNTFANVKYQLQKYYPADQYYTNVDDPTPVDNLGKPSDMIITVKPGDGAAVANAIASVEDCGTVFLPAGEYNVPIITNLGNKEIVIQGEEGSTLNRTDEGFITIRGSEGAKVTVRGMTFKGTIANDTSGSRGVCFSGQNNSNDTLIVDGCTFEKLSTGIYLGGVTNATITNCTFTNCNAGIGGSEQITGTLTVDSCTFSNNSENIGWAGAGSLVIKNSPSCKSFNEYKDGKVTSVTVPDGNYGI